MRINLVTKTMVPAIALVVAGMAVFGVIGGSMLEREVRSHAQAQTEDRLSRIVDSLNTADQLSSISVHAAMKLLMRDGLARGSASVSGAAEINGSRLPALRLGSESVVGNYELVDRVSQLTSATATLFVRRGADFVRVSTNVRKPDGSRAVGTVLDPNGRAAAAIRLGQSFYGTVDILGKPFMTGYEPMRNPSGEVVGVWYVGYPLSTLASVQQFVASSKVLEHGYAAVLKPDGRLAFGPEGISEEQIQSRLRAGASSEWTVATRNFERWGYTVAVIYPNSDLSAQSGRMRMILALCALLVAATVIASQYFLQSRFILAPLHQLALRMENADLNTALDAAAHDELGDLARSFDQFVSHIRATLGEVVRGSQQLAASASHLAETSRELASSMTAQQTQVEGVAIAMHEMSDTVGEVSDACRAAADASTRASETARKGEQVVDTTVSTMRQIAVSVTDTAASTEALGTRSSEIGRIVSVIDEIADQTNLLALNASIEAARAGEQGRGFAVVADEIRKLAERTTTATAEIARMISTIQEETQRAVQAMRRGRDQVEDGVSTASEAGQQLKAIIQDGDHVSDMATQIATATAEQSATAAQINDAIGNITQMSTSCVEGVARTTEACDELLELAGSLDQLMSRFQLSERNAKPASPSRNEFAPPPRNARPREAQRARAFIH